MLDWIFWSKNYLTLLSPLKEIIQAQANPTIGSQILWSCDILQKLEVKFYDTCFCYKVTFLWEIFEKKSVQVALLLSRRRRGQLTF
jgi:hypothetical protein